MEHYCRDSDIDAVLLGAAAGSGRAGARGGAPGEGGGTCEAGGARGKPTVLACPAPLPGGPATLRTARPEGTGLRLDHVQRRVWTDAGEIQLTFREFELLAFLSAHPATVFTRADLVGRVWQRDLGHGDPPVPRDSRTVDVHISRLRRKLGPRYGQCLVTEYRVGYQFRPPTS